MLSITLGLCIDAANEASEDTRLGVFDHSTTVHVDLVHRPASPPHSKKKSSNGLGLIVLGVLGILAPSICMTLLTTARHALNRTCRNLHQPDHTNRPAEIAPKHCGYKSRSRGNDSRLSKFCSCHSMAAPR